MMAIKFKAKFNMDTIRKRVRGAVAGFEKIIFEQLDQVGTQFIIDVRTKQTYTDRTRNLRGSTAYIILKDGVPVREDFDDDEKGKKGQDVAKKTMKELAKKYPVGYVLILIAGMNYAIYVEAKGYDVITGSSQIAADDLKKRIKAIQRKLK